MRDRSIFEPRLDLARLQHALPDAGADTGVAPSAGADLESVEKVATEVREKTASGARPGLGAQARGALTPGPPGA